MNQPLPFPPPLSRQHVLALPEVDPPPALWDRIAIARREAVRRRRRPVWLGLAAACGLVALLGLMRLGRDAPPVALQATAAPPVTAPASTAVVPAADPG